MSCLEVTVINREAKRSSDQGIFSVMKNGSHPNFFSLNIYTKLLPGHQRVGVNPFGIGGERAQLLILSHCAINYEAKHYSKIGAMEGL